MIDDKTVLSTSFNPCEPGDPGLVAWCFPRSIVSYLGKVSPESSLTSNLADYLPPHAALRHIRQFQHHLTQVPEVGAALHNQDVAVVALSAKDVLVDFVILPSIDAFADVVKVVVSAKE